MNHPRNPLHLFIDLLFRTTLVIAMLVMIPIGIVLLIGFSIVDALTTTFSKPGAKHDRL